MLTIMTKFYHNECRHIDVPDHGALVFGHIALVHHSGLLLFIHYLCHLICNTVAYLHPLLTVGIHVPPSCWQCHFAISLNPWLDRQLPVEEKNGLHDKIMV